eukprot:scpid89036/ scgid28833/ 
MPLGSFPQRLTVSSSRSLFNSSAWYCPLTVLPGSEQIQHDSTAAVPKHGHHDLSSRCSSFELSGVGELAISLHAFNGFDLNNPIGGPIFRPETLVAQENYLETPETAAGALRGNPHAGASALQ